VGSTAALAANAAPKRPPGYGLALVSWAFANPLAVLASAGVNTQHIFFSSGLLCCANFGASTLGQLGIESISASASAFITGFYVVFTPILMYILPQFSSQRPGTKTWLAVVGSMIGLFIISDSDFNDLKLGHGEVLTLGSACFWTIHIFATEWAVTKHDAVDLTFYEMIFISVMCTVVAFYYEEGEWEVIHSHIFSMLCAA
jgi:drug/metabolite transporter (DMT)-like permease